MNWLYRWLCPNRAAWRDMIIGFFQDWDLNDPHVATDAKTHAIWVSCYSSFSDQSRDKPTAPLLDGLYAWQRRVLWSELCREKRKIGLAFIENQQGVGRFQTKQKVG